MKYALALALSLCASAATALELALAGATVVRTETNPADSVRLPVLPHSGDAPPPQVEGKITRTVLQTDGGSRTTLQTLAPIRDQLSVEGYQTVFTCADRACGGFDFRFQLDLLPPPEMFVDLGDYRYLLMQRAGADPHTVSIVTSRSNVAGFIHITLVGEADVPEEVPTTTFDAKSDQVIPGTLIDDLVRHGFAVLGDVDFTSGSATLSENAMPSLDTIGEWLQQNPGSRIALVGHTDSVGDKAANQALSERRAQSVRARILQEFDVAPSRVEADGVGYLAPIAPNATSEGRALNRRVEVVLLTSE